MPIVFAGTPVPFRQTEPGVPDGPAGPIGPSGPPDGPVGPIGPVGPCAPGWPATLMFQLEYDPAPEELSASIVTSCVAGSQAVTMPSIQVFTGPTAVARRRVP